MMYMLIEFLAGRLPWKGLDRKETAVIKQTISNRRLLQVKLNIKLLSSFFPTNNKL